MRTINKIKIFKNKLSGEFERINQIAYDRHRTIKFKDVMYYSSLKLTNNYSYDTINSLLKSKEILNVSKTAIIKRKNNTNVDHIHSINSFILNTIYEKNSPRRIAVDGSKVNLSRFLKENDEKDNGGFKLSKNKNYTTALVSSLFDIDKEIPINYGVYNSFNEREALVSQLKYCKKQDILIMDRGYYSHSLLCNLLNLKLNVVFRVKSNYNFVKEFNKLNKKDATINYKLDNTKTIKMRVINYTINTKTYYLLTNLINSNKYNFDYFKDIYKKRWKVETNFRHSKYNISMNNIKIKRIQHASNIIAHNVFIQLIEGYIRDVIKFDKEKYKINKKNSTYLSINEILYLLLYKKMTKKIINRIIKLLDIIKTTFIYVQEGRHYSRIRKKPASKWCMNAIKFKWKYKKK